tara:strand:+ start:49 stop:216 length:168 start_codon:yes stop_codon:yes gene_type:complete
MEVIGNMSEVNDLRWMRYLASLVILFIYICGGLYWYYPEVLEMLFWPFYKGWLAH